MMTGAILRYLPWVYAHQASAVLTLTIVVLVVALVLRPF